MYAVLDGTLFQGVVMRVMTELGVGMNFGKIKSDKTPHFGTTIKKERTKPISLQDHELRE